MEQEKIISRIKKMLAIAHDNGATEGERDNALRMAYTLLAKHNLSMGSLEDKSENRDASKTLFYGRPWAQQLVMVIANMFFCEYVIMKSGQKNMAHHILIGKESNRETAMVMSQYLVDSIRKEAAKRARELGQNMTWRRSFCVGAVDRIRVRVSEMKQQAEVENEVSTGTSLVLVSLYEQEKNANRQWLSTNMKTHQQAPKKSRPLMNSGYSQGDNYGKTVSLNRQIGG